MDKQLERIIRLIDCIGNNDTDKKGLSIDLPKPIREAIKDSVSYDSLVAIIQTVDPTAIISLDKKELTDKSYKLKRNEYVGTWDDVYYFCFLNNGTNMDVYGLDEAKRPIVRLDGTIDVKMKVGGTDKDIFSSFYVTME